MEDRLRKFAQLVDSGSFTHAARELHISQPALTASIQKLERELHAALLIRGGRHVRPTDAGRFAYEAACEVSATGRTLKSRIADLTKRRPRLRAGFIDSIAGLLFSSAACVDTLEEAADLSITVDNSRQLRRFVAQDSLDIAFITEPVEPDAGLRYVASEPLILVCHRSQAHSIADGIQRGVLRRFISYDLQSSTYAQIHHHLQVAHLAVRPVIFSTSPDVMLQLVKLRKGCAILPYGALKDALQNHDIVTVGPKPFVVMRRIAALASLDAAKKPTTRVLTQQVQLLLETCTSSTASLARLS